MVLVVLGLGAWLSHQVLQSRYQVSYHTIKRSLSLLIREKAIQELANGKFMIPAFGSATWKPRVVCIVPSIDSYAMAFGQHDEAVFRALQAQCEQANITLDVYLIFAVNKFTENAPPFIDHRLRHRRTGRTLDAADLATDDEQAILGYVHCIPWVPENIDKRIVAALTGLKKPVAIIDETSMLSLPAGSGSKTWMRKFTVATGAQPAQAIARHLLALGHRRIAFISADHQYLWSQLRLKEVSNLFADAGISDGVIPFVAECDQWPFARAQERCDLASLEGFYASWREKIPEEYCAEMDYAIDRIREDTCERADHRFLLTPLLKQALADSGITAWVAVNDTTAAISLAFLKSHNKRVPEDLSLIAFDDSTAAMRSNITSYNFNTHAIATGIIGFVLERKPFSDASEHPPGFLVDRGSTRKTAAHLHTTGNS